MNIVDIIKNEVNEYLDNVAIIENDREISYDDLLQEVEILKKEFSAKGMQGHKKIGLFFEDSIEYIIISLAVLSCECVIVPISPALAWDEVSNVASKIDIDFLVSSNEIELKVFEEDVGRLNCNDKQIFIYQRESEVLDQFCALNPAFIRFSSGTTSASKGVVISHESILDRTDAANKVLNITSDDNIVWVLSMSYHFVVTVMLFLRKAATIILCEDDFPFVMFDSLKKNKCTFMYASPFHYRMLLSSADVQKENLTNLRMAISTAIGFTEKEISKFYSIFSVEISEAFGIIEVGLPFVNSRKDEQSRGSVGKILPDYQIQIRDKGVDGVGVIYLKGKGMFDAYFHPFKVREQVLDEGWFNTGDLGCLNDEGILFIKGREKNVINFTGMKIFPEEVEEVLNSHLDVKESFVYGVDHDVFGQLPKAKVVLNNGEENRELIQKLRKFCYERLSSYKTPKDIKVVNAIEKTKSGKIKRV